MIPINCKIVDDAINKHQSKIVKFTNNAIKRLKKLKSSSRNLSKKEKLYLTNLIAKLDKIVVANPGQLTAFKRYFPILPKKRFKKRQNGRIPKQLNEKIVDALGYTGLRGEFFPEYFNDIGIKACVYCNSSLTVAIESISGDWKAKFQADHYISKGKYPCFSISLFNLYPVCASCNNAKLEKSIQFELYTDDVSQTMHSKFQFKLALGVVSKFINSRNLSDIVLEYSEPPLTKRGTKSFREVFDIQGIYDTQKDLVEELILKSRIYNTSYKNSLISAFPQLYSSKSISNRLLIGNYAEPRNMHKRPMAKFVQDISRQLKLVV
jgi:hypothetical protein